MKSEDLVRLELENYNVNLEDSDELIDSNKNHTIYLKLNKEHNPCCPYCNSHLVKTRGYKTVTLKYSTTHEDNIKIVLKRQVYICESCHHYFKQANPFEQDKSQITLQKDMKILEALKDINSTYTSVAKRFGVSPTYVIKLFDQRINVTRKKLTEVLSFDKVYNKNLSKKYCFVIYSPQMNKILDILDSRKLYYTEKYFRKIPLNERNSVKYISINLNAFYRILAKKCFKKSLIYADSFHVIKNLNSYFNELRIDVMKKYEHLKSNKDNYYWLYKKFWKLLLANPGDFDMSMIIVSRSKMRMTRKQIVDYMLSIDTKLKEAYELKEKYKEFNKTATINSACERLNELINKFLNFDHITYHKCARLLISWHDEIVNSFNRVNNYRISNGKIERANKDIGTIFDLSFGSHNFTRLRNKIMFAYNKTEPISYNKNKAVYVRPGKKRGKYKRQ